MGYTLYIIIFNNCLFELAWPRQDVEGGAHAEDPLGGPEAASVARLLHEAGEDGEEVVEEVHVDGVAVRRYAPECVGG